MDALPHEKIMQLDMFKYVLLALRVEWNTREATKKWNVAYLGDLHSRSVYRQ